MKTLPITLATDESIALRRFASERGMSLEQATTFALREWLIDNGYMEMAHELDEDSETVGSA